MPVSLPSWPPTLTSLQRQELHKLATTWALSHGLCYLPPATPGATSTSIDPPPAASIHAPVSLLPTPFPRSLFLSAQRLQPIYNTLYSRVALDTEFLDRYMGCESEEGVGKVDSFTGKLWQGWKTVREEGAYDRQPFHLGLFRSDYLLHTASDNYLSIKQVEFNTISSSFGPLSERVAALHRHIAASTSYYDASPLLNDKDRLPENETTKGLVQGLVLAHGAYGVPNAKILFVVQPNERNVFDQRWLEFELLERHNIKIIRRTLDELAADARVDPNTHNLFVSNPTSPNAPPVEISTIYFRACYTPNDFSTPLHFETRFLLERSRAIKCPSLPLQLAGGKKIQEVLTRPGVLEQFLPDVDHNKLEELKSTFMGMYSLDLDEVTDRPSFPKTRANHLNLVLKPQREGGGNNVYKEDIPAFLDSLSAVSSSSSPVSESKAWIAMEIIRTPPGIGGYLVRSPPPGSSKEEIEAGRGGAQAEIISELGIFGYSLFGVVEDKKTIKGEETVGWLVRTKGKESNEGGVATGFSVLDSLLLVD
ncbi:glutathione synthase [Marasmius fiardii PR-910]|nr:glutathione synthase [Marasmius fiardii PR-910]